MTKLNYTLAALFLVTTIAANAIFYSKSLSADEPNVIVLSSVPVELTLKEETRSVAVETTVQAPAPVIKKVKVLKMSKIQKTKKNRLALSKKNRKTKLASANSGKKF